MNNISKTKNKKYEFNFCFISNRNSFITTNYYFKPLISFPKNIVRKHCNIIFSNSHKKTYTVLFEFERNIMNEKRIFDKKS
jgi:hypothetical protein